MSIIFLLLLVAPLLASEAAGPQRLRPQCRAGFCDDRPECPRTSCRCLFASRMDCDIYYQCVDGKPYQYRCSPGLLFNADTLTCDYSYNVNCPYNTAEPETTALSIKTTEDSSSNRTTTSKSSSIVDVTTQTETSTSVMSTERSTKESETTSTETPTTTAIPSTEIATTRSTQESSTTPETTSEILTTRISTTLTEISTTKETSESEPTTNTKPNTGTVRSTVKEDSKTTTSVASTEADFASTTILVTTTSESTTSTEAGISTIVTDSESPTQEETSSQSPTTNAPPSEFICPSRFGLFPDPKSCFRFYHCSHWVPYHKWCPSGLHFNPSLKVCDWPYRAGCAADSLSTSITELSSTRHPRSPSDCDCDCCELPIPGECSAYILCIDRVAFRMQCSNNLYFNPMTGTCDFQENVLCTTDDNQCPEPFGRFPYPGSFSYFIECHDGENIIRKCPEGLYFNQTSGMCSWTGSNSGNQPDSPSTADLVICNGCNYCFKPSKLDCSDYVKCSKGIATKERCPSGLYFNPSTELCDHGYNVECPTPQPQPECPQKFGYFPYTGECSKYLHCVNGSATVKSCPGVLHFDPVKKHCDWPWVAGCGNSNSTPTPKPETETVNCDCDCCLKPTDDDCQSFILCINQVGFKRSCSSGLFFNTETENCDFAENVNCTVIPDTNRCPEHQGLFPYPDDCQKFIHCSHGIPYIKDCPSNLHFNPQLKVCDWPYEAGCQSFPSVEPPPGDGDMLCDICDSCFIPDANDCSSYIYCRNGKGYRHRCTENLLFNPEIETCDLATNVKCPNPPPSQCPKPDGLFPAEVCAQFIHCSNGIAFLKDCPDGLHFNVETLVCDWPENAKCGEIPVVVPTPSDDGGDNTLNLTCNCDCCFLPNVNDCSKYFLCLDGYMYEGQCARDLLFNPTIQNCDYAERVSCGTDSPLCPEPNGLFPNQNYCSSFIRCSNGIPETEYCRNGTHFNAKRKQCLDPCVAKCDSTIDCPSPSPSIPITTVISSSTQSDTGSSLSPICIEPNGMYPVDGDCSAFYQCSHGRPYMMACPQGLHFSSENLICEHPCFAHCDPTIDCSSPTAQETTSTVQTMSPECLEADGLFPNHDDCGSFYQCSNGRSHLIRCPSGLHFSPKDAACESPCVAGCDLSIDCSSSTTQETTSTVQTMSPECLEADGLYRNHDDCGSFYQCSNGRSHLIRCPSGLHFNLEDAACETPCAAGCDLSIDCSSPTTQETTTVQTMSPECLEADGLFPNPSDCGSFYQCSNGRSHLIRCPSGLHFSPKDAVCESPCVAGCDLSIDCSPTTSTPVSSTLSPHCLTPDGLYSVVDDCTAFYLCANGKEHLIHCPPGLHYSVKDETCEHPCDARCSTIIDCSSTTKQENTSTVQPTSPECIEANGLFSNPDDCGSFYQCSNGRSHLMYCPSGLHFNLEDAACERPCVAGCDLSIACPTEIPGTEGNCTCEACYLPDPEDCSAFYFCSSKTLTKGYCPYGTLFDKISSQCQDESIVNCEANGDPSMCPEPFGYFPYPGDCKKFLHCDNSVAHIRECEGNLEYDPENKVCTKPKGYCGDIIPDPHCIEPTGLFPDPENCSIFYHCEHGVSYLKRCSTPLMFNPVSGVCDWPENVNCGKDTTISNISTTSSSTEPYLNHSTQSSTQSTLTSTSTEPYLNHSTQSSTQSTLTSTSTTSSTSEPCYEVPGVICPCACRVPTYDECSSFFQCQEDGTACKKYCPEGLYFNKKEMVCDLPSNVECRDFFFATIKRAKQMSQLLQFSSTILE